MSGKRTKLTDIEKFFVQENPQGLNADELAEKLDVSLKSVKDVLNKNKAKDPTPEPSQPKGNPILKNAIINKTAGNSKSGISIMTAGGSEMLDDTNKAARKRAKGNTTSFTAKSYPERAEN